MDVNQLCAGMSLSMDEQYYRSVSFCGCCFLGVYEVGVYAAILEYAPQLVAGPVCGCSVGSIIATCCICDVPVSVMIRVYLDVIIKARAHTLGPLDRNYDVFSLFRKHMLANLPENAHELCTGRLRISLTRLKDMKNVVVTEFHSKADLVQAVVCSSFIPVYMGLDLPKFHGETYIDGGLSDNQPVLDEHTITVSPFSGTSDICPKDNDSASMYEYWLSGSSVRCTASNLYRGISAFFPPSVEDCSIICAQGFKDALKFLVDNDLTPCVRCLGLQLESMPAAESPLRLYRNKSHASLYSSTHISRKASQCSLCSESTEPFPISEVSVLFSASVQKTFDESKEEKSILMSLIPGARFKYPARLIACSVVANYQFVEGCASVTRFAVSQAKSWLTERVKTLTGFMQDAIDASQAQLLSDLARRYEMLIFDLLSGSSSRNCPCEPSGQPSKQEEDPEDASQESSDSEGDQYSAATFEDISMRSSSKIQQRHSTN